MFFVPRDLALRMDTLEEAEELTAQLREDTEADSDGEEIDTESVDVTVTEGTRERTVDATSPALEVESMGHSALGEMLVRRIEESDKRILDVLDEKLERVLYQKLGVYSNG